MKFRSDNKIRYMQDCAFKISIPNGIDFIVERVRTNLFELTAHGYGQILSHDEAAYGSGSLLVAISGLTKVQLARFTRFEWGGVDRMSEEYNSFQEQINESSIVREQYL